MTCRTKARRHDRNSSGEPVSVPTALARRADERALEIFEDATRSGRPFAEMLGQVYMLGLMAGIEAGRETAAARHIEERTPG